jgi:hypothetical protein
VVVPGGHTDVSRSPLYPYVQVSALPGGPEVTGSVATLATCGTVAPAGVVQVTCSAR